MTSENAHLRRLVDEADNKNNEQQVPFQISSDNIGIDMTKLEQMKQEFEKEKEILRVQRSQAEEKCINVFRHSYPIDENR